MTAKFEISPAEKKYATKTLDSEKLFADVDPQVIHEFSKKFTIMVATHNRGTIVNKCMQNMVDHKRGAKLIIYDDGSEEYGPVFLKRFTFHVHLLEKGKGKPREAVAAIRTLMVKDFLENHTSEYLYMADSDAYHDPMWLARFQQMNNELAGNWSGMTLFLSYYHTSNLRGSMQLMHGAAGISMLLRRDILQKEFPKFKYGSTLRAWDSVFSNAFCKRAVMCSDISYVEHIGYGGMNNKNSWERVRARNATHYLIKARRLLIPYYEAQGMTGHSRKRELQ